MSTPRWPETALEWTRAVSAAVWAIGVHSAIAYGLITGPEVDVERCELLLAEAKDRGLPIPTLDEVLAAADA